MNTLVKIITTLILSFIALTGNAQENSKSNLWKIEGNGIKTSYLFGTMHLIPQKEFNLKDKVKTAFEASEQVVLELDMADPQFMKDVMAHSYLENGQSLKSFMDDSEYELLDTYLKEKTGTGMSMYNTVKPFMLMSVLLTVSSDEPLASFEMTLLKMAKESNKEVEGLETYASQVAIFEYESYEKQIDDLVEMIQNPDENKELYAKMAKLYIAEDIEILYDYMDDFMDNDIEMLKKFLDDRNNKWIPEIAKFSKEHSVFYGFGAGHLGGKQGVVNLLKEAGYTVTPVLD
jgi:hypothetical protein